MGRSPKLKRCIHCKHQFSSPNKLRKHLDNKVCLLDRSLYKCEHCPKVYLKKKCYQKHQFNHQVFQRKFTCRTCNERFLNRSLLYSHIIAKHRSGQKTLKCRKCFQTFTDRKQFFRHHTKYHLLGGRQLQNVPNDIANAPWSYTSEQQQQKYDHIQQEQSGSNSTVPATTNVKESQVSTSPTTTKTSDQQMNDKHKQQDPSAAEISVQDPQENTSTTTQTIQFNEPGLKEAYDLHAPFILQKHEIG